MNYDRMISVIVPVYNAERWIKRCVKSIINQTYKNIEIILINDGSTDLSGTICEEYRKQDSRIVVHHKKNEGPALARNYGIEISRGAYIAFVDSDDWIEPQMYEKLIKFAQKYKTQITGCATMTDFEDGSSKNMFYNRRDSILDGKTCILDILYQTRYAWGAMYNKLYKREVFESIRFPNIMNLEDYVVSLQLYNNVDKIFFCSEPMYHYMFRKGSLSKRGFFSKKMDALNTSEKIRQYFIDCCSTDDIIAATNYFVFRMYATLFWEIYKRKPSDWKILIKAWKWKSILSFKRYILWSEKQKGDWKRIIQYLIAII